MASPDDQKRKDAIKALVNMSILEAVLLIGIVGVYVYTGNITYLIGGFVGLVLIFGPMLWRWWSTHGEALKSGDKSGGAP